MDVYEKAVSHGDYIKFLNKNRYNNNAAIRTPFHKAVKSIQCDQTSSSFPLKVIERTLEKHVYPYYTNTHSNNALGKYMSRLVESAKTIVRRSVGASRGDNVIFTGFGASGAINHLVHLIKPKLERSIVIVSETEHYSNYLPWYHYAKKLIVIETDIGGVVKLRDLEAQLKRYRGENVFVSMSACSNITGTIQPVDQIAALVHKYSGKVFFDFATSAPYVSVNMHKDNDKGMYYDAIFISTHKIPGGVSSPGILVFNSTLACTDIPYTPNGGTVRFVTRGQCPVYSNNMETRETGGTPNILGIIRAGMAFAIRTAHIQKIFMHELKLTETFQRGLLELCARHKNLKCLVPVNNTHRLPIFSIQLKGFHYNYIVVLLSDLFGITTRGGVNCSGILAEKLLKLNGSETQKIKDSILHGKGVPMEYGWVRITLTSIHTQRDIEKILKAIDYIAKNAKEYMSSYKYLPETNVFVYRA